MLHTLIWDDCEMRNTPSRSTSLIALLPHHRVDDVRLHLLVHWHRNRNRRHHARLLLVQLLLGHHLPGVQRAVRRLAAQALVASLRPAEPGAAWVRLV